MPDRRLTTSEFISFDADMNFIKLLVFYKTFCAMDFEIMMTIHCVMKTMLFDVATINLIYVVDLMVSILSLGYGCNASNYYIKQFVTDSINAIISILILIHKIYLLYLIYYVIYIYNKLISSLFQNFPCVQMM